MMRKGFSLVEMITVLGVVSVVLLPVSQVWFAIFHDIPAANDVISKHTQIDKIIEQMKKDINAAVNFPASADGITADSQKLLIELPERSVCYDFGEDEITRYTTEDLQADNRQKGMNWSIPDAVIQCRLLKDAGKTYAVAVETYIEQETSGIMQKKLANSHIFFVGVVPEALK